jgi:hypothetical protein
MTGIRLLALAAAAVVACASAPRPVESAPLPAPLPVQAGTGREGSPLARVTVGMEAAEVRRRLGAPERVEQIPSAAAQGARYERWSYGEREVTLLDGKVVDVLP